MLARPASHFEALSQGVALVPASTNHEFHLQNRGIDQY